METKHQGLFAVSKQMNGKFAVFGPYQLGVRDISIYDLAQLALLVRRVLHREYEEQLHHHDTPMYRYAATGAGWYGDDLYYQNGKEFSGPGWKKFVAERARLEKLVRDSDPFLQAPTPRTYNWAQRLAKRLFKV